MEIIDGLHPEQVEAHAKLDRMLRKRVRSIRHIVTPQDLNGELGGLVQWERDGGGVVLITWDPFQYDLLWLTIHEMLHPPLEVPLQPIGGLEEGGVVGITDAHCKYIRKKKARVRWWRRAIKERMTLESFRRWLAGS